MYFFCFTTIKTQIGANLMQTIFDYPSVLCHYIIQLELNDANFDYGWLVNLALTNFLLSENYVMLGQLLEFCESLIL